MLDEQKYFEHMPLRKLFVKCAVPSMISMMVVSLYMIIDGIFVGRFVGSEALAAVNLVMPALSIFFAFIGMVATGSSVQMSIKLGEKDDRAASKIFSFAIVFILILSLFFMLASIWFVDDLVRLLGGTEELIQLSKEYAMPYALLAPVVLVFFALDNFLRVAGKPNYSMGVTLISSVLNIVLDYLFIVRWGWGIGGAAWASALGLAIGAVFSIIPFIMKKVVLRFTNPRISVATIKAILFNGSSQFFSSISGSVSMIVFNGVLLHLTGAMGVAALSIVMYINDVVMALLMGMVESVQPAISYNYGAKKIKRVYGLRRILMLAGATLCISVYILVFFNTEMLVGLFLTENNPELLAMAVNAARLFMLAYGFMWFNLIADAFFTAINKPMHSLVISSVQVWVFQLGGLMILPKLLGVEGIWLTAPFAAALTTILAAILLRRAHISEDNEQLETVGEE